MNPSARRWCCAGLAPLLAGWFAWRESGRAVRAEAALAAMKSQIGVARANLAQAQARDRIATERRSALSQPDAARRASPPPTTPLKAPATNPAAPERPIARPWLTRLFAENPVLHALYLDAYRKNIPLEHGTLMRLRGYSAEEIARYVEILVRDMERATEIGAATRALNLSSVDPSIKAMTEQREREREEALRALRGGERVKQVADLPAWAMARDTLNELVATLHATPTPLTFAQSVELAEILRRSDGLNRYSFSGGDPAAIEARYNSLITEASGILLPAQFEVFRSFVEAHRASRQLQEIATRSRTVRPPPKTPAPAK
jgi:hypothetical protein